VVSGKRCGHGGSAALRPRVEWTSESGPNGIKKKFSFVAEGVDEIEKVIKDVFPYAVR
jgi:hypothetical protein